MRIAISVHEYIANDNGTTIRAKRVFELLKNRHDITLIARGDKGQGSGDVIIIAPQKTRLWNPDWNMKLIPVIMKNKFDCILCSNDFFGFFSYFMLSKIYKYKIIFEVHGIPSEEGKERRYPIVLIRVLAKILNRVFQIRDKFVVKHATHVLALSQKNLEFCQKFNRNIDLVPVFVDTNKFRKNAEKVEAIRKRYEIKDSKVIGLIGPFESERNRCSLEFLYKNLDNFDNRVKFVVIGECNERIFNERIIYTGYVHDLSDYLSCLDVVLVVERFATTGPLNKIIEPMSCSLPVFTTPKGVVGLDYAESDKNILVFREDELLDKVNELIFNEELMSRIARNAQATVEQYYSKKANETKLIEIIESVVGKSR